MKLKPFGIDDSSYDWGYTLPVMLGHLESLARAEEEVAASHKGSRAKRLEKVQEAVQLLNEAMDMGSE